MSFSEDKITEKTLTNQIDWQINQGKLFFMAKLVYQIVGEYGDTNDLYKLRDLTILIKFIDLKFIFFIIFVVKSIN
jgi:hypothetical protein